MKAWWLAAVVSLFLLTTHPLHLGDTRLISPHPATPSFPMPRHPLRHGLGGRKTKLYSHHRDDLSTNSNSCQKAPPTNPPSPPSPPPRRRRMLACDKAPPTNPPPPPSPPPRRRSRMLACDKAPPTNPLPPPSPPPHRRRMLACDKAPPTKPPSPPPPPQGAMLACDKAPPTNPPPPPPLPPQRGTLACDKAPPANPPPPPPPPCPHQGTLACNKAPPTNPTPPPSPPPQGRMLACDKAPPTNNPSPPPPPPPPSRGATLAGWFKIQVLSALEIVKTQRYHFTAIFIAGMTFFTNFYAYDLFCISLVPRLLRRVYSNIPIAPNPRNLPANISAAANGVGLCGTLPGQLLFGSLGNKLRRKRVYVITLLTVLCSFASGLFLGGSSKAGMPILCFFPLWLGFGIGMGGCHYPLSATIMSNHTNDNGARGPFIAVVLAMQKFDIFSRGMVSIIVSTAFKARYRIPRYAVNSIRLLADHPYVRRPPQPFEDEDAGERTGSKPLLSR